MSDSNNFPVSGSNFSNSSWNHIKSSSDSARFKAIRADRFSLNLSESLRSPEADSDVNFGSCLSVFQ
jgi:hypothetical protein